MPEAPFDPYLRWLGIRDPQRPPNHYRLLGLELFETDPEVIATAADRQMAHVRTFQSGQFGAISQRLLNELAAARVCLLNAGKKAGYDEQLRRAVAARQQPAATPKPAAPARAPTLRQPSFVQRKPASRTSLWVGLGVGGAAALACAVVWIMMAANGASANNAAGDPVAVQNPAAPTPLPRPLVFDPEAQTRRGEGRPAMSPTLRLRPEGSAPNGGEGIPATKPPIATKPLPLPLREGRGEGVTASKPAAPDSLPRVPPVIPTIAAHGNGERTLAAHPPAAPIEIDPFAVSPSATSEPVVTKSPANSLPRPLGEGRGERSAPAAEIRVAAKPAAKPDAKPLADQPAKPSRLPIPAKDAQATSEKTIQGIFKADFEQAAHGGPDAKSDLAKKLLQQALDTADDPTGRYVLLTKSEDLSLAAGDLTQEVAAIDKLAELYEVDALSEKFTALTSGVKNIRTPQHGQAALDIAMSSIDEAIAADSYEQAGKLAKIASSLAAKIHNAQATAAIRGKMTEIDQLKKEFDKVVEARATLAKAPNDPEANFIVGYFLGAAKGDFPSALAYLAIGSDLAARDLAKKELTLANDSAEQAKLADDWWRFGEDKHEMNKSRIRKHACDLFAPALPHLKGLARANAEAKLKQFQASMSPTDPTHVSNAAPSHVLKVLMANRWEVKWSDGGVQRCEFRPNGEYVKEQGAKTFVGVWRWSNGVVVAQFEVEGQTYFQRFRLNEKDATLAGETTEAASGRRVATGSGTRIGS